MGIEVSKDGGVATVIRTMVYTCRNVPAAQLQAFVAGQGSGADR